MWLHRLIIIFLSALALYSLKLGWVSYPPNSKEVLAGIYSIAGEKILQGFWAIECYIFYLMFIAFVAIVPKRYFFEKPLKLVLVATYIHLIVGLLVSIISLIDFSIFGFDMGFYLFFMINILIIKRLYSFHSDNKFETKNLG